MASSSSNLQDYMQRESNRVSGRTDIHNLPSNQITVLKLISEPNEMPYKQLCKTVELLPGRQAADAIPIGWNLV